MGGAVQLRTDPRDKHPYFRGEFTGGRLGTYRGRDRVGGYTLTKSLLRGTVRDARRTPDKVSGGGEKGGEGRDNNGRGRDDGEQGDYSVSYSDGDYRGGQLGTVSGPSTVRVPGGEDGGGGHVSGSGPDLKGE